MKLVSYITIIVLTGVIVGISICNPNVLANNSFLKNFINEQLLNILTVIATVTAASAANIHLAFNRAEESVNRKGIFDEARREVNGNVYLLIGLLAASVVMLIIRSMMINNPVALSLLNGVGLIVLVTNILVLIDITSTIFAIHPFIEQ